MLVAFCCFNVVFLLLMKCIFLGRRRLGSSLCAGLQKTAKACQVFIPMKANFQNVSNPPNFRGWMGPDLQIVVLDMSLEEQMERIRKRHEGNENAVELAKVRCEKC